MRTVTTGCMPSGAMCAGAAMKFLKEIRTEIKIALIGVGILIVAGVSLLFSFVYFSQKISYPIKENPSAVGVFEGVPKTYADCMKTDSRYNIQQGSRSQLLCFYSVGGEHSLAIDLGPPVDNQKFKECDGMGGYPLTFAGDCTLTFYNPDYIFPTTYGECIRENKGEFTDSPENRCVLNIRPFFAYNKEVAKGLSEECISLGGTHFKSDQFSNCFLEFREGEAVTKPQNINKPSLTPEELLGSGECKELISNHNKIADDRIDLVFIGFGYDLIGKFKSFADQDLFGLYSEEKGLFEVEPFLSNKEKFNFWFVDKMGESESQDLWELSSICRKKFGINNHKFSPEEPLFSDRMFTIIFVNQEERPHHREHFYTSNNTGCSKNQDNGACGLKGVRMPMPEDDVPSWYYSDFLHNFGHAFTFYNINIEYRPNTYYDVLDEYVRFDVPYSPERDWKYIVRDHSNCFVGTYEQCISKQNNLFGDMMGDRCGKDGVIDCCTNDTVAIEQGALSCKACPGCKEDTRYDIEVACYEGCWFNQGNYRSTFDSIMRGRSDTQEFGKLNEKILCHQMKLLTGEAGGICNQLLK